MSSIAAFAALSLVLVLIPGPAVMLVLKSAVARGRAPALLTALGVLAADLVWAGASVAGLTALLVSSQMAFDVVHYLGAAYLVFLGGKLLLPRSSTVSARPDVAALTTSRPRGGWRAFREGLLSDLSNPKTVIVFTSVIPQFVHHGAGPVDTLVLGVAFAVIGFLSLTGYAVVFSAAAKMLRNARVIRVILRAGGAILAAFGVGLAVERPAG
ncbi:threonine/homoserine/homoserine lactone efflux protein [Amycolatopsis echigonensis]|uniref:Threonine/homoserine/homoserine lactone efflux protein n=1 Tax=Amycolatopsis echigonensis TaxID=2576905 RepID=A0A2N3WM43_9PSEU|nr:LysE family translocator [Amycolatopsis niigatensis]PKV94940.1 threonine/homoserine/homoserine lactone efflux protein [Amycolatopsis niigatensis]